MYQTLKQKQKRHLIKGLSEGIEPVSVRWKNDDKPAIIQYNDGGESQGSCIRCYNPPCIQYSESELEVKVFKEFPADLNISVCPTTAIKWPIDSESPEIDQNLCISCGLCVSRCPVRAIYLDKNGAHINNVPNSYLKTKKSIDINQLDKIIELFSKAKEYGIYQNENEKLLCDFWNRFIDISKEQSVQFPNHLARNLLIATGIGAAMRRVGDTNIRMDMVLGPPGVNIGTAEVEFGIDVLDAPRTILDNIAVLSRRYNITKEKIVPLIVCSSLPNNRSEYWRVIKDIRDVLNIKISSITIGILVIILWNRAKININKGDELYIDTEKPSLRQKIIKILGRKININTGYPGFLESEK